MRSMAGLAVRLAERIARLRPSGLVVAVDGDHHAEALARMLRQLVPDLPALWFPAWDCLPYDKTGPSSDVAGRRMRALHDLARFPEGAVILTTAEALIQRVPAPGVLPKPLRLKVGTRIEAEGFATTCARFGYRHDDRVDDPGEIAPRGEVIDIYPPLPRPYRIAVEDGVITSLYTFDPVSQHTVTEVDLLRIDPVSEVALDDVGERFPGMEHWLPQFCAGTTTLLEDYCASATLVLSPEAERRLDQAFNSIAEAHRDRVASDKVDPNTMRLALQPDALYLSAPEWRTLTKGRIEPFPTMEGLKEVPRYCLDDKPGQRFAADLKSRLAQGQRMILSGPREKDMAVLAKEAERAIGAVPVRVAGWAEAAALPAGGVGLLHLAADHGFEDSAEKIALITAADLVGHYARARPSRTAHVPWHLGDGEFTTGDVVIHLDHGVGILKGLEAVSVKGSPDQDAVRLIYANDTSLIVPVDELDRVWRYGSGDDEVTLDRLDTPAWHKRRAKIARDIDETAAALLQSASVRRNTAAPEIVPSRRDYERFVAGFRFSPTADQMHAVEDCLRDLASAHPMDRLLVGDVGFGKTEVALRAAAAAVLAGYQVAVVAPTTVLVRQHVQSFSKRFADIGISVAHLSRLVPDHEAEAVRDGLADGRIRLVVGTHALAAEGVHFAKLGLLIVDEEQRFGMADKAAIRALGTGVHVLTLTATPIPRTLQSAMVGLQELSVMTTPPALRRPIRTHVVPFDTTTLRAALLKEKARGGQSFVVVPRIEDLESLGAELAEIVPTLAVRIGHARMDAQAVDAAMTGFAAGDGDVLLATSIIESGLDVPRANTMVVCGAERFGLAQLHQLRGRVGRGRQQGVCYLMTQADHEPAEHTKHRLATLARLDRLGSGLAISAQDLDARGAGNLAGEDQAGHMQLIGLGLYQHLLQLAIRRSQGEPVEDWMPELHMGGLGRLETGYIPEPDVRLNLYARLARVADAHDLDALLEETEDRFGPLPESAAALFACARLRCLCRAHRIARIDAGPKAIAFTPRRGVTADGLLAHVGPRDRAATCIKDGRLLLSLDGDFTPSEGLSRSAHLLHALN